MPRMRKLFVLLLLALPLAAQDFDKTVTDLLAKSGAPSASVAIVRDGKIVYARAFGNARLDPVMAATPQMRYSIGSISKQFTAAAILLLAEEGKLTLDDKVVRWLPELTRAKDVTIRQLLSMTSGYQDFWPQDYVMPMMMKPVTPQEILTGWAKIPLDFEPGTKWQYSNTNYVIAGMIAEKVAGMPLLDFLRARVFNPLKMTSVSNTDEAPLGDGDPMRYLRYAAGPPRVAPKEGRGWMFAAGELAMTAHDLALWDISVIDQSILQPASYRALDRCVAGRGRPHRDRLRTDHLVAVDVREPEEAGNVGVDRMRPQLVRRGDLNDVARAHHGDAVAERERLRLVVRDVHRGQGELVEEPSEVLEQPVTEPPVERAERLVEKQDARLGSERASERDSLLLAPRERSHRAALEAGQADEFEQLRRPRRDPLVRVAAHSESEPHVCRDVAVGEERVVLEHEPDTAPVRGSRTEIRVAEHDAARVGRLEARDDTEQRRLAGAAGPEDGDDLAVRDFERGVLKCSGTVEPHAHVLRPQHQNQPPRRRRTRSTRRTETTVTVMRTTASA